MVQVAVDEVAVAGASDEVAPLIERSPDLRRSRGPRRNCRP